jgi:hypothetical protein
MINKSLHLSVLQHLSPGVVQLLHPEHGQDDKRSANISDLYSELPDLIKTRTTVLAEVYSIFLTSSRKVPG